MLIAIAPQSTTIIRFDSRFTSCRFYRDQFVRTFYLNKELTGLELFNDVFRLAVHVRLTTFQIATEYRLHVLRIVTTYHLSRLVHHSNGVEWCYGIVNCARVLLYIDCVRVFIHMYAMKCHREQIAGHRSASSGANAG